MKKAFKLSLIAAFATLMFSGAADATPFSSLGWVNPSLGQSWDETTLEGTAQYTFEILNEFVSPSPNVTREVRVNTLELFFESDIFDTSYFKTASFKAVEPQGWTFSFAHNADGSGTWLTATANGSNYATYNSAPLTIDVNYKLLSADRFAFGAAPSNTATPWDWYESQKGGSWAQEYILSRSMLFEGERWYREHSGGSTAPVPEPATAVLFSAGILGLFYLNRNRKKNQNQDTPRHA